MEKNEEIENMYIGSISETISVNEQRKLLTVMKMSGMLTKDEFTRIMSVYGEAIDRIFKENGLEDYINETKISKQ